jgi:hypothetical protein
MKTRVISALKNWQTSAAGVVVILTLLGPAFGWITPKQAEAVAACAAGLGLVASKDSNKSGV